ncbi:unnamed protein product [Sympodiomycopsis kandeliae]
MNGFKHQPETEASSSSATSSASGPSGGARRRNVGSQQQSPLASGSGASTPTSSEEDAKYPRRIVLERTPSTRKVSAGGKGGLGRPGLKGTSRPSYTVHAPNTPFDELDLSEVEFLRGPDEDAAKKGLTKYRRSFFIIGILLGAAVAWLAAQTAGMEQHMTALRGALDDQLLSFGVDLSQLDFSLRMPKEFAELGENLFSGPKEWLATKDFRVGRRLKAQGYTAQHPVVLMPGIISTGLESWTTDPDVSGYFRKRLWGTTTMMRTVVLEKDLWIKHLSLDPQTGLDPPGIKVRAAEGMDAASYFVSGYWIWSKIIENLAVIGYDPNSLYMASYDWRLSYGNLQVRDKFFTRLKLRIEQNLILHGQKTVLVAHSMGSSVALYFMKWVEAEGPGFGNGGSSWCEDHLEAFTSIAGTFLGVPKAMAALLSGEMRDTVEVPPAAAFLLEKFFSRKERARLFRTWAGSASMLIKGGDAVWGNETWAPDDWHNSSDTHGPLYAFKKEDQDDHKIHLGAGDASEQRNIQDGESKEAVHDVSSHLQVQSNLSASDALTWLLQQTPSNFQRMVEQNYSNGIEYDEEQLRRNNQDPRKWSNPLEVSLPVAPSMKVIAMYGVGKPTERSYYYEKGPFEQEDIMVEGDVAQCQDTLCTNETERMPLGFPTSRSHRIDTTVHDEKSSPKIRSGCKMGEGDGTVSLLSLGAMSVEGWKRKRYNPGNCKITTYELNHQPEAMDLRGGQTTGDHVDILGAWKVNELVLKIASGRSDEVKDHFVSDIEKYAKRIDWGGIDHGKKESGKHTSNTVQK